MLLVSSQLSSVDYEGHRSYEIRLQNHRSVSTQCRQRTDLRTPAGKLYVHAGADAKKKVTAIDLN